MQPWSPLGPKEGTKVIYKLMPFIKKAKIKKYIKKNHAGDVQIPSLLHLHALCMMFVIL